MNRVSGIVFLATPHNGARIANYVAALGTFRSADAVSELRNNASLLRDLSQWFRNNEEATKLPMQVYFETMNTYGVRVVDEGSADVGINGIIPVPVDSDRIDIAKPPRPDLRVNQTTAMINQVCKTANGEQESYWYTFFRDPSG